MSLIATNEDQEANTHIKEARNGQALPICVLLGSKAFQRFQDFSIGCLDKKVTTSGCPDKKREF